MFSIAKPQELEGTAEGPVPTTVSARQIGIVAALLLAFMVVVALSITPRYETIDDMVMHEYAAGLFFALKPDDHLIYTHVFIGKALCALYSFAADFAWYPLYQSLVLYCSSLVICLTFVKIYGLRQSLVPSLTYAFAVLAPSIICMQFTTTAAIAGIAGGVMIFAALEPTVSPRWRWFLLSGGTFAVVFASLMRQKAGWMVLVLFSVYATVRYFGISWRKLGITLALAAVLGAATQALWMANDYYYKSTGWGEFETWRRKLHPLYDFSRLDLKSSAAIRTIKSVGWSANDVTMLNTCMHWDRQIFSVDKLNRLVMKGTWVRSDLKTYLPSSWRALITHPEARIALFLLLGSLLIGTNNKFLSLRRSLVLIGSVSAVALAITVTHKASMHVYLPMLYMLCVARLTSLKLDGACEIAGKKVSELACALVVCLGCIGLFALSLDEHYRRLAHDKRSGQNRVAHLRLVHDSYPNKLACTLLGAPKLLPFEPTSSLRDLKLVSSYTSWNNFGMSVLTSHGIADLGEGLLSGKVLVLSNEKQNNALGTFFKEHYGLKLNFKRISKSDKSSNGVYDIIVENRHTLDTTD